MKVFARSVGGFPTLPRIRADPFGAPAFHDQFATLKIHSHQRPERIAVSGHVSSVPVRLVYFGWVGLPPGRRVVQPPVGGAIDLNVLDAVDRTFVVQVLMTAKDREHAAGSALLRAFEHRANGLAILEAILVIGIKRLMNEKQRRLVLSV